MTSKSNLWQHTDEEIFLVHNVSTFFSEVELLEINIALVCKPIYGNPRLICFQHNKINLLQVESGLILLWANFEAASRVSRIHVFSLTNSLKNIFDYNLYFPSNRLNPNMGPCTELIPFSPDRVSSIYRLSLFRSGIPSPFMSSLVVYLAMLSISRQNIVEL